MCRQRWITAFVAILISTTVTHAENLAKEIKKAVERSTLDSGGVKPFHLKAVVAPSFERDKGSGRTGEIEIWWASATRWKKELRCPGFHQIEILDGAHVWQKNEGDYFPEWLQQTAIELIEPVPPLDQVLQQAKGAELRQIGPMTNLNWTTPSGTAETPNILRSWVALDNRTRLLLYAGGLGWGAEFKDYADFHGRMIARTVNVGTPQVTARISTLEDLGTVPADLFETASKGQSDQPLRTVVMDEASARRNLLPGEPSSWPAVQDGPLEGKVTAEIIIDREGRVKEIGVLFSDNPGVNEAGNQIVRAMRFKPFQQDGALVQVVSQFSIPFRTSRPAGTESFDSAHNYFEHGRQLGFPAFGHGTPYMIRAEFDTGKNDKTIAHGRYEDTWLSDSQWRREVRYGNSSYIRSRNGDKTYQLAEGPDVGLLRLVMKLMEPIPTIDTFVESDWKIKRDTVNGARALRVLAGYESPEGKLDPEQARGYWFDDNGLLLKTYFKGIETQRSEFQGFAGVQIAHRIEVFKDGKLGMRIHIMEVSPPGPTSAKTFEIKGHEWTRAFTAEVR
jgi:hypothetical protein